MIELQYFERSNIEQLINWIPSAEFTLQWGGPAFQYPLTSEQLEKYLEEANKEDSDTYIYKVIDQESQKVIGHISLGRVDRVHKSARVGKVLVGSSEVRGKGIGSEMMKAVLTIAFEELKLHKVTLGVFDFNASAIRCYENAGFVREGFLRDARKNGDEYWNLIEMGILENEWREINK
ncbi:GNAT family N-acetyltransferase [Peribacillus muralis]|uniref:GNAT family N-acetyltransferase n=1 Tax=Peribacillus muralis TaxID=264697 RepID=A0A1B3XU82_9BACI|nr:GNAT family protein [Peribacillus muralis]AOH56775.1 GNAT family N-acetyltransferase [Peribacillus muralis]